MKVVDFITLSDDMAIIFNIVKDNRCVYTVQRSNINTVHPDYSELLNCKITRWNISDGYNYEIDLYID